MSFSSRRQRSREDKVRSPRLDMDAAGDIFRRSRTLTGSISSKVVSAVEQTSRLRSPRLEAHELKGHRRKLGGLLAGCILAAAGAAWCIDLLIVRINTNNQAATRYLPSVQSYLDAHPLERIEPWLDKNGLSRAVQHQAPEVLSVDIDGRGGYARHGLTVTTRTPVAKWQIGSRLYYVDGTGVAFEHADGEAKNLVNVKDESGLPLATQQVTSRHTMQFIGQVVAEVRLQAVGKVTEVILPPGLLKEIDVLLEGRGYRLKLYIDRDPSGQVRDMGNALRFIDQNAITPKYVDLRVEGKAFYRE